MKYPIDPEVFIRCICPDADEGAPIVEATRILASAINNAYRAGLTGKSGYPIDAEARFAEISKRQGISLEDQETKSIYFGTVRLMNLAYGDGIQDALKQRQAVRNTPQFLIDKSIECENSQRRAG